MSDGTANVADVTAVMQDLMDPETGRKLVDMKQLYEVRPTPGRIDVTLGLTTHSAPLWEETRQAAEAKLRAAYPAMAEIHVTIQRHSRRPEKLGQIGLTAKSVVVVGSGKGGVGKSTIAAALACGLQRAGCAVGLVDADVYGPSIPQLLGIEGRPEVVDNRIQPIERHGLKVMSMGFLVPPGEAVVWRGPMLHGAITQFLRDTAWGDLDYLIIDMPPGTGDIALTLSQLLPLTGAIVVCTPQKVALLDAIKAIAMFRKVHIPLLGMVENMSGFVCPSCNQRYDIFGSGGARLAAQQQDVPFLGEVPINLAIRTRGDAGTLGDAFSDPTLQQPLGQLVVELARNLARCAQINPPLPTLPVL
jgi:ATP-binding protein involved in chromosome partitioning